MATRRKIRADRIARAIISITAVVLVAAIIVLVVFFAGIFREGGFTGMGAVVVVPEVIGMPEEEALALLMERGLTSKIQDRKYNDTQPKNAVFKQNPPAESKVKEGRRINLWISLGPANFTVPDLAGLHIDNAAVKIIECGLKRGSVRKVYSPQTPQGRIISQNPKAGTQYRSPVPVDVVVADQENLPQVVIPDLIDLRLPQAEQVLYDRNLQLAKVSYVASDIDQPGTVVGQNLASGDSVKLGGKLELEIAVPSAVLTARTKSMTIRIQVPPGIEEQAVKLKIWDALAPESGSIKYESRHKPGEVIEQQLDLEGDATVMIFIGDMDEPYRVEYLKTSASQ